MEHLASKGAHIWALTVLILGFAVVGCGNEIDPSEPEPVVVQPDRVADYIKSEPFGTIRLEIDIVPGKEPPAEVVDNVVAHLEPVLQKPLVVDLQSNLEAGPDVRTFQELRELAAATYDGPQSDDETVIHVLIVNGTYGESQEEDADSTLGIAWSNRNVVLFADSLTTACTPDGNDELRRRGLVERACNATFTGVWVHEIGHVIGLVNNGLPMVEPYADPDHPTHDSDPGSIMYWAFDVAGVFDQVKGKVLEDEDPVPPFSPNNLADIAAMRAEP